MLKRQVFRMGFFCQGAYLLIAASNGGNLKQHNDSSIAFTAPNDSVISVMGPKVPLNAHAEKFAAKYIKNNSEGLLKAKERSRYCFDMMDSVFTRYQLPVELKYLAVVESELKTNAVSHVGAVGPWQLMPATARILGLKVTKNYDERKYYTKSTVAAAKYIRDLYGEFGDWLLVLAAYNGGPGPVYTAMRKSGSKNFWKLQQFLPAETRGHVKRFISTHYFFENKGSITTLTKAEMNTYQKKLDEYRELNNIKPTFAKTIEPAEATLNNAIAEKTIPEPAAATKSTL